MKITLRKRILSIMFFLTSLLLPEAALPQDQIFPYTAQIYADGSTPSVRVYNLKLDFRFAGYGVYKPADYPTITFIPLETGESVQFANIVEASFTGKRVQWKKFIAREDRKEYKNLDLDGYYHWSEVELETSILDAKGERIKVRMKKPEAADVYLTGQTDRGSFELKLNEENNKTVKMIFHPSVILQCSKNPSHVYSNPDWKFCPICGAPLKVVESIRTE